MRRLNVVGIFLRHLSSIYDNTCRTKLCVLTTTSYSRLSKYNSKSQSAVIPSRQEASGKSLIFGSLLLSLAIAIENERKKSKPAKLLSNANEKASELNEASEDHEKLKIYRRDDVKAHGTKESGIWVTYKDGVYDITEFVDYHPGGDKILLAAGGAIDPYWALYAVHKTDEVLEILEEMRIGRLDPTEATLAVQDIADPYANDPPRHPALIPSSEKPYNAETPPSLLTDNFLTPNDIFFVRNHLPVPIVDISTYKLEVGGKGIKSKTYTLDQLKSKFKSVKVTATLQCAGNRRNEMNPVKQVKGLTWGATAISNAEWTGVRLCDVLADAGLTEKIIDRENLQLVQFEGFDRDPISSDTCYGASIELDWAVNPKRDVIVAYEMNGQPLPVDHGFPLRAIVPGIVGARNVKWLNKILVSDEESHSHWQRNDYKSFCPSTDWDTVDFDSAPAIQEYPVQSAICSPYPGQKLPKGSREVDVKGYAWSGGGRRIIRVDVSADGGKTWKVADLERASTDSPSTAYRSWAWVLWTCTLPLPVAANADETSKGQTAANIELICKATDLAYNTQPDSVAGVWNLRGVINNAWHRIQVTVPTEREN